MTRSEIDAFFAIVKTGNMTAAANSLFITQPALSRRIQALENELGYPLFIRGKGIRSNELTLQGEHFFLLQKNGCSFSRKPKRSISCPIPNPSLFLQSAVSVLIFCQMYFIILWKNIRKFLCLFTAVIL